MQAVRQRRSQGPLSTSRKYPGYGWSSVYACQPNPHRGWGLNLILSLLSKEAIVALLNRRYFEREAGYFSEILPDLYVPVLRLNLRFYECEMLIERELCL